MPHAGWKEPQGMPALMDERNAQYITTIPVLLDRDMALRLSRFRAKIAELQQQYPDAVVTRLPTQEKVVALTFDDGPDASTHAIIKILNRYGVRATFFLTGEKIRGRAYVIKAALRAGHMVLNHGWAHIRPTESSTEALLEEVRRAQNKLNAYTDTPRLFRPPYGLVTEEQLQALIKLDFRVIVWSVDSLDWYLPKPEGIVSCVMNNIHPGAIVLLHSGGSHIARQPTIKALPVIIEQLQALGYRFVTLDELL